MAQLISVKLSRFDGSPWGFRLQGGKDFGTPLVVQKVNGGSPAEAAGLRAGDAVIRVNSVDMYNLRHKDAQDVIVKAGNNFEMTVQRGGSTWKPHVAPVSATLPSPSPTAGSITPVTKTSLAAKKQDSHHIGSGHNFSPKPFLNGTGDGSIKSIVNKQYNSPVGIYSEETIAETLSAQAEVLAGGVLGVNFKKNEKNYNAENSEVFKMVQEADKEPKTPEPAEPTSQSGVITPSSPALAGLRPVSAPETKPQPSTPQTSLPPGQNICAECERLIVGVFVRIKDKNLHVECFKCSTCGTSLKNVGYYNINNKLYCDIHAKMVARQNAPSGLVPITVPPGGKAPANTISAALANAPLSPPLSSHGSSPQPFSAYDRSSPDRGCRHPARRSLNRNGCIGNGECNGESKTFTSTITIQTGGTEPTRLGTSPVDPPALRSVQAPTTNSLIGPKPFGAPSTPSTNLSSPPILNSGSSTLPRPQSQTVTGRFSALPKPKSSPFRDTLETQERFYRCEIIEDRNSFDLTVSSCNPSNPTNPSNPSSNPSNPSDLSDSPNPRNPSNSVKSRSLAWPPQKQIEDITYPTASPLYIDPNPALDRRGRQAVKEKKASIEACVRRRSESRDREIHRSRGDPMDRISCPGPAYRKVELVDDTSGRSRATTVSRASSSESLRRSLTPTRIVQPIPKPWTATVTSGTNLYEQSYPLQVPEPPQVCKKYEEQKICRKEERMESGETFREEQRAYRAEICRREQTISGGKRKEESKDYTVKEVDSEVTDLQAVTSSDWDKEEVPSDGAACPKGVGGEHDLYTETSEEDVGNMHVKKTMTYEKTVEPSSRPSTPAYEQTEEICERRSQTHVNREIEDSSEHRTVSESAETVTSAVETQRIVEQAMREEEERKREEEAEEKRKQEEEERRRREEEERKRREEEERNKKHVSFSEDEVEEVEEVREQPLGRTVVREERITETDTTPGRCKVTKETYEEITEEVLVQERVRRRGIGDVERKQSLRDQVEVHQSLRDQVPEKRLISKYSGQAPETMETCKKHVQFIKQTDTGPKPLDTSGVKNSVPKEWKSEMVNALTTAPDRPYTPLSTTSSVKEVYTEETIYLDHRGKAKPKPKEEEIRPISPFQQALTIAPERPYTPLSRPVGPEDVKVESRSETPVVRTETTTGHCPPADILYGESSYQAMETRKVCTERATPRPLPTPPPGYRLRDSSRSPVRSRSATPSAGNKPFSVGLKKPDTIPAYQRNLVAVKKDPVESHPYVPSRTPTPTPGRSKSPAQGPPEPPPCYTKLHAPRIRDDPPPSKSSSVHFPKRKTISYQVEEDTDHGHRKQEYAASRTVQFDEKQLVDEQRGPTDAVHAQYQEQRFMTSEETSEEQNTASHCTKSLKITEDFERCEKRTPVERSIEPSAPETPNKKPAGCAIRTMSHLPSTLPCPLTSNAVSGTQTYTGSVAEARHVRYDTRPSETKPCPETGVTVLPCKAHSDRGSKAGVVVLPCEGQKSDCSRSGVCVTPTSDRSGVCVSPCPKSGMKGGMKSGACGQPSGCCGRRSSCDFDSSGCPDGNGICVTPCGDGSVCVAPCGKASLQTECGGSSRANIPFPQIPLPYEDYPPAPKPEPPRRPCTNLSGQLARLTAKCQSSVPTVQLYKPVDQDHCQSDTRRTQNHCQDGIHCSPSLDTQSSVDPQCLSSHPDLGSGVGGLGGVGSKSGSFAGSSAPKRGRGILNQAGGPGSRLPLCAHCNSYVRGPFITALGQIWCPDHFVCVNTQCRRPLQDIGFVEEKGQLYCEYCFEKFIAPTCSKCNNKIKGDCLNAIGKHFHPECFSCSYCGKLFGNSPFFLEEGLPYCEADWNELFTTKCFACGFPVEAGDRWVEALNNNYHSQCFNCTMCKKNLEGQSFYAKGGRPFCKNHAR